MPVIPAYIWLWPNLQAGASTTIVLSLVYIGMLGGTLIVGIRRWSLVQLGLNRRRFGLGLLCGAVIIAERLLAQWVLGLPLNFRQFDLWRVAGEVAFYFCLAGFVEELLFRGLVYRALLDWRGPALAVVGSSLAYAVWHIGWAGPSIGGHFLIGLLFALIRWPTGGVAGLVVIHGLFNLLDVELRVRLTYRTIEHVLAISIANPYALLIGNALLMVLIMYMWKVLPRRQHLLG